MLCSLSLCWTPVGYQRWSHSGCFLPSACGLWWVVVEATVLPCIPSWRPTGKPLAWEHGEKVRLSPGCPVSPSLSGVADSCTACSHGATCPFPIPGSTFSHPAGRKRCFLASTWSCRHCLPHPGRCAMESLCGGDLCFLAS